MWLPNTGMRHNERGNCVGYRKNACMHVEGAVTLGCNGVLMEF